MQLLAIVEYFPPVLGHDLRIYELALRLPPDWSVRFLVLPRLRGLLQKESAVRELGQSGIRVVPIRVSLPRWLERAWKHSTALPFLITFLLVTMRAAREAREARPEVIVANYPSPYTGLVAYAVSRLRSVPFVVDFCDDIVAYFQGLMPSRSPEYVTRAARRIQDFLIRRSAVLPVVTQGLFEYATQCGVDPARIEILPNGVDLELFENRVDRTDDSSAKSPAALRCFYGGSLDAWSGSSLLLDLARRGRTPTGAIELYVAGHPFPKGNGDLPPNLHHLGLLDKEELARALQRCDCVLVPMSPGSIADAASPVKLFEGLAAGKPCICSRARGISEVIVDRENGLLVDTLDADAWFECIQSLEADPKLRLRLAEGARRTAPRFSWTVLSDSFGRLLERARSPGLAAGRETSRDGR